MRSLKGLRGVIWYIYFQIFGGRGIKLGFSKFQGGNTHLPPLLDVSECTSSAFIKIDVTDGFATAYKKVGSIKM